MARNPLRPGASRISAKPSRPTSFTLLGTRGVPDVGLAETGALGWSQWLCHLCSPDTVILSAEALALRRAKQAQRRAQRAPSQLSDKQKELVRTLLGAHTRHVGTMFDQFVQFRVSLDRLRAGR